MLNLKEHMPIAFSYDTVFHLYECFCLCPYVSPQWQGPDHLIFTWTTHLESFAWMTFQRKCDLLLMLF